MSENNEEQSKDSPDFIAPNAIKKEEHTVSSPKTGNSSPKTGNNLLSRLYNLLFRKNILTRTGRQSVTNSSDGSAPESPLKDNDYEQEKKRRRDARRIGGIKATSSGELGPSDYIKMSLLSEYNLMDLDPLISSVLDIYCEEIINKNEEGSLLKIKTSSLQVKSVIEDFFQNVVEIEKNLYPWIRRLLKYGDVYLKLDYQNSLGITDIKELPLENIQRIEYYNEKGILQNVYFKYKPYAPILPFSTINQYEMDIQSNVEEREFEYEEVLHIRLLKDRMFFPYGTSILESSRQTWKRLYLLEEAMLIHKLTRAPNRLVYKLDVTSIPEEEEEEYVQSMINELKRTPVVDESGNYNMRYNINSLLEDYFILSRGGQDLISIDSIKMDEMQITEELNYLLNRLLSGFKIPKAFYSYDDKVEGKATLTTQDIRFAKTTERYQTIICYYLKDLAFRHLYLQGFPEEELYSFDIQFNISSRIYDSERIDLMKNKLELANELISSNLFSKRYVYEKVFGFTDAEITELLKQIEGDVKEEFRFNQIKQMGNDPKITGKVYDKYGASSLGLRDIIRSMNEARRGQNRK